MEKYEISKNSLYIIDEALGLNITCDFNLPSFSGLFEKGVVHSRDEEKRIRIAYLEKDNKKHGLCMLYYPEGAVQAKMYYCNNQLHGPCVFYSPENNVLSKSWFCYGKRQGNVKQYYLLGSIYSIERYVDDLLQGKQEYFYENGMQKTIIHYKNNKLHGEVLLYWPNGNLKRKSFFQDGKKEETESIFNEKAVLIDEGEYKNNLPINTHRRWDDNHVLQEEIVYDAAGICISKNL